MHLSLSTLQSTPISNTAFHLYDRTLPILGNPHRAKPNLGQGKNRRPLGRRATQVGTLKTTIMVEEVGMILRMTMQPRKAIGVVMGVEVDGMGHLKPRHPQARALHHQQKARYSQSRVHQNRLVRRGRAFQHDRLLPLVPGHKTTQLRTTGNRLDHNQTVSIGEFVTTWKIDSTHNDCRETLFIVSQISPRRRRTTKGERVQAQN